jgi:hypothetical protein
VAARESNDNYVAAVFSAMFCGMYVIFKGCNFSNYNCRPGRRLIPPIFILLSLNATDLSIAFLKSIFKLNNKSFT